MTTTPPRIVIRYITPEMDEVERSDEVHARARLAAFYQARLEHGPDVHVRFTPPPNRLKRIWAAVKEGLRNE
jgi:hypothetical protein